MLYQPKKGTTMIKTSIAAIAILCVTNLAMAQDGSLEFVCDPDVTECAPVVEQSLLDKLFDYAEHSLIYDMSVVDRNPTVEVVSKQQMRDTFGFPFEIYYVPATQTIYMTDKIDLDTVEGEAALLSQVVYHIQYSHDPLLTKCQQASSEYESLRIYIQYLLDHGQPMTYQNTFNLRHMQLTEQNECRDNVSL